MRSKTKRTKRDCVPEIIGPFYLVHKIDGVTVHYGKTVGIHSHNFNSRRNYLKLACTLKYSTLRQV